MRRAVARTLATAALALGALQKALPARADGALSGAPEASPGRAAARSSIHGLREILELADRNHPQIMTARAKLLQARAQLDEAHFAPFSQFRLTGGVALAPALRGNNVFSPNTDVSLTSSL